MITNMIILHGVAGVGKSYISNKIINDLTFAKTINPNIKNNSRFVPMSISLILKRDIMYLLSIESIDQLNRFKVDEKKMFDISVDTIFTLLEQMHSIVRNNMVLIQIQKHFNVNAKRSITINVRKLHQQYADLLKAVTKESVFIDAMLDNIYVGEEHSHIPTVIVIDDLRYYVEAETISRYCKEHNIQYSLCNVYGDEGYGLEKHSSEYMLDKLAFDKYIHNNRSKNTIDVLNARE